MPCVLPACMRKISVPEPDTVVQISGLLGRYLSAGTVTSVAYLRTYAHVGSESEKRRDKLDGRAQGCTRSAWGADRLGTAIGCDPPNKFDKYRCRGTDVPELPVSQRGNGRCAVRGTGASGKNCIGWLAACCACCKHACGKYQSLSLI